MILVFKNETHGSLIKKKKKKRVNFIPIESDKAFEYYIFFTELELPNDHDRKGPSMI